MQPPPEGLGHLSLFQFALRFLNLKVQMEAGNGERKNMSRFERFPVGSVTRTTYVYRSLLSHSSACGGTFFEQDWQSLICPDGADSEVRGLYILNPS